MLKRIELRNFESHKHTVIDCVSPGFNLVCGESNAGKTSIVRALKLVAYNDYDPASLRLGAKFCTVIVETDRGTVKVERGKDHNHWEVTPVGGKMKPFDKVGVAVVPEAAEIIGLNIVTLGDVDVPVNIMDQLESHFMLKGVGDKNATGSMRAEIVDEISGLSGIEGVIKDVSLDVHRFKRQMKQDEKTMQERLDEMHDEAELAAEESVLDKASSLLATYDECKTTVSEGSKHLDEWLLSHDRMEATSAAIAKLPDAAHAKKLMDESEEAMTRATEMSSVRQQAVTLTEDIAERETTLAGLADDAKARRLLDKAQESIITAKEARELMDDCESACAQVEATEAEMKRLDDCAQAAKFVGDVETVIARRDEMKTLLAGIRTSRSAIEAFEAKIQDCGERLAQVKREETEILSEIEVCPLFNRPVSDECRRGG